MRWRVVVALAAAVVAIGATLVAFDGKPAPLPPPVRRASAAVSRPPVLAALDATAAAPTKRVVAQAVDAAVGRFPAGEHISGLVVDATTGSTLWRRQAVTPVAPASTLKLLTAAAALRTLGPRFAFTTTTRVTGSTVYLVGGGDPTLVLSARARDVPTPYPPPATLSDLAARTAAALPPRRSIRVRIDASAWPTSGLARGWSADYVTEGDVTPPSALELDGGRVTASDPDSPRTGDPAGQAGAAFVQLLRQHGVPVRGRVMSAQAPASAALLATVSSPPLDALVQRMLTDSDNDLAECLGRAIARKRGLPPTFAGEAEAVAAVVRQFGVARTDLALHDASGLSHDDRVAPAALVAVLRAAAGPAPGELRPVVEGLPVAAFTGTLADRYRHEAAKAGAGVVRAKTGSLTGVNGLAGLVVDRAGRLLAFAVLSSGSTDRDLVENRLDEIASVLAGLG